jgi:site-specific recombinase XerD
VNTRPNVLARTLVKYFDDYLPTLRGMSVHTVRSYRDAIILYLRFVASHTRRRPEDLDLKDFTFDHVSAFLADLERTRRSCIATRNARLAALHTFARFAASQAPEHLAELQRLLAIPFKRGARRAAVDFLDQNEVNALLAAPKNMTLADERDLTLFALMLNTGARVQEILDVRIQDVRIEPPYQVRLRGKGGKIRVCPIWAHSARRVRRLLNRSTWPLEPDRPLFLNLRGEKLTRFGVYTILKKRIGQCTETVASLRGRRIHPHTLRHTTAVHLLKAGIDFATISQWLGHASLNTTMVYARADLDLKRQALSQVFPDAPRPPRGGRLGLGNIGVVDWLRRI